MNFVFFGQDERELSFGKKKTPIKEQQDKILPTKSDDNTQKVRQVSKSKETLTKASEDVSPSRSSYLKPLIAADSFYSFSTSPSSF